MKRVGVIGGMGPKATVDFLNKVISSTPAKKDQEHLSMIITMNPQIPDRSEAILNKKESPLPALVHSAKFLEAAGVHFIVIPCVTAHFWLKEIQDSITIPILSLVDATLKKIKREAVSVKDIGILTTTGAIRTKIFDKVFKPKGYRTIIPREDIQDRYVMDGIYSIKMGEDPKNIKSFFLHASQYLIENGAKIIVAACTEIPLSITQVDIPVPFIDVNEALAEATVSFASL